ncbi:helix-turn-helix transcriptional regulator [Candidatus Kaiserbacteria bacterium]|nr:helix-turn-helix transcriptional regulator [Candidatus Kaiserbacteria bacterium]
MKATNEEGRKILGSKLQGARQALGLSQARIAAMAGISPVYWSQIETGLRVPSDEVLSRLTEILSPVIDWKAFRTEALILREPTIATLFNGSAEIATSQLAENPRWRQIRTELKQLPDELSIALVSLWLVELKLAKEGAASRSET